MIRIYNRIIENFITESNPEAIQKTQKNIALVGQREPGVTLADGRIVDGNRRFTCLRRMQRESADPVYFETVIMEMDIREDKKQIKLQNQSSLGSRFTKGRKYEPCTLWGMYLRWQKESHLSNEPPPVK